MSNLQGLGSILGGPLYSGQAGADIFGNPQQGSINSLRAQHQAGLGARTEALYHQEKTARERDRIDAMRYALMADAYTASNDIEQEAVSKAARIRAREIYGKPDDLCTDRVCGVSRRDIMAGKSLNYENNIRDELQKWADGWLKV